MRARRWLAAGLLLAAGLSASAQGDDWNGFDLTGLTLPREGLAHGGQPRDGIPALDAPKFAPGKEIGVGFEERVVGVEVGGVARAYPRSVLVWHEVVNDRIGDLPFVLVYSPLSGTVAAFERRSGEATDRFGVSGLVYNSGTLLFDRATSSLWLPLEGLAITGPRAGEQLRAIVATETSWADWLTRHPDTAVMTAETGHQRPYGQDPYADYISNSELRFPVSTPDARYHPKEPVLIVAHQGKYRAYPFAELAKHDAPFTDAFAGQTWLIDFNYADQRALVTNADGKPVPAATEYWFAWRAGHPKDTVYTAPH